MSTKDIKFFIHSFHRTVRLVQRDWRDTKKAQEREARWDKSPAMEFASHPAPVFQRFLALLTTFSTKQLSQKPDFNFHNLIYTCTTQWSNHINTHEISLIISKVFCDCGLVIIIVFERRIMSDAWAELQALKSKRDSRRKRLEERKKERRDILRGAPAPLTSPHSQSQGKSVFIILNSVVSLAMPYCVSSHYCYHVSLIVSSEYVE